MSATYKQNEKVFILCHLFFFFLYFPEKNNLLFWQFCLLSCSHQFALVLLFSRKASVSEVPSSGEGEGGASTAQIKALKPLRMCPTQCDTAGR